MKGIFGVLFLIGLSVLILGALFYFVFIYKESTEEVVSMAQLERFQDSAEAYKRRLLDYQNVCRETGVKDILTSCSDSKEGYRMLVAKGNGTFLCADSTGFLGEITDVYSETLACVR